MVPSADTKSRSALHPSGSVTVHQRQYRLFADQIKIVLNAVLQAGCGCGILRRGMIAHAVDQTVNQTGRKAVAALHAAGQASCRVSLSAGVIPVKCPAPSGGCLHDSWYLSLMPLIFRGLVSHRLPAMPGDTAKRPHMHRSFSFRNRSFR